VREVADGGVTMRLVTGTPPWAAEYALEGVEIVTRYTCSQCGELIAVLARDS
jgi:hypothetical protein